MQFYILVCAQNFYEVLCLVVALLVRHHPGAEVLGLPPGQLHGPSCLVTEVEIFKINLLLTVTSLIIASLEMLPLSSSSFLNDNLILDSRSSTACIFLEGIFIIYWLWSVFKN